MPTTISMSEEVDIQWGTLKNLTKTKTFYSSFISEGVEYHLFDNVEVYNGSDADYNGSDADDSAPPSDPYIGKIVKLWEEKESGMRKALIRWFFRHKDINQEMEGDPRELYLAFGMGKGVTNENDLEVICGKCKVLCTSKDARNQQPSARDLKNADFFFSKIYNVDLQHVSPVQRVVDKLGCEAVYNKPEWVTEVPKNKEKAVEQLNSVQDCKRDSTLKRKAQCMGDSPSDLKDKQRGTDVINNAQQAVCQGSDLTMQQSSSMNKVTQNKKLKTSATISPPTKGNSPSDLKDKQRGTDVINDSQQKACADLTMQQSSSMNKVTQNKKLKTSATMSPPTKGDSPSDLKDKQRGTDVINDSQQKACADLTKQQSSSMNKVTQKKKLKTSATISPPTKGDSPSDLEDKQRGTDVINDSQLKACADLTMQQSSSMNKVTQNKKLKTSATVSPPTKVATANRLQKSENTSSLGEVVASKIPTSGDFVGPSSKVEQKELRKMDLLVSAPAQTNLNTSNLEKPLPSVKTSVSETASHKVDDALGQQAARQLDEKGRAENILVKETCIDAQKIKEDITEGQTNSLTQAKCASSPLKEEEVKNPHEKIEMDSSASNSRLKGEIEGAVQGNPTVGISLERKGHEAEGDSSSLREPGNGLKETIDEESRSDISKMPPLNTGSVFEKKLDSEKKLFSTTEPVRVAENWKIFKELPWEQNLQQGITLGRVLLLQNLDPSLASADVRDMLKNILQGVSDVRLIPQETLCPYAQALAIFESKLLAESALQEMERKCLVVANNRRPIIASMFKETPTNFPRFPGHLALEKLKLSRNLGAEEYKKAVSTSHCSQPNTIEYEMAMEWRRLQEIIQTCRAELFERQRKEMEEIRKGCGSEGH